MRHLHRVLIDSAPTATFQRQEPAADLRPYVAFFWQSQPTTTLYTCALPNSTGVISFNLGALAWQSAVGNQPARTFARSQVFGHLTQPCQCVYPAGTELFGATLQPGALALLLGVPAAELANFTAGLPILPVLARIEEALRAERSFAGRAALLQAGLRTCFPRTLPDYRYALVQAATARFTHSDPGQWAVGRVAEQMSITPKSLSRYFQQIVGVAPKRCAQLARFKQALAAYRQAGSAWDCEAAGYSDFAHFARTSHRLLGRGLSEV